MDYMKNGTGIVLTYHDAVNFVLPRHYSGRIPPISYAFGWVVDGILKAVCTFGKPASPQLCFGICGREYQDKVLELNRLCREDDLDLPLSQFVAFCLRELSKQDFIIVSYADTAMHHHGYVYQACNFLYTGATKARTDKYTEGNKHSRHYNNDKQNGIRKVRSSKHRYVFFATRNKKIKKLYMEALNYKILPYPKGDNQNYVLGEYLLPNLVKNKNNPLTGK